MAVMRSVPASKASSATSSSHTAATRKAAMEPQLRADLLARGLSQFAEGLLEEGVERAIDLHYLDESQLERMGMKRVHARKLREIAASAAQARMQADAAQLRAELAAGLERAKLAKKMGNQMMKAGNSRGSASMYKSGVDMLQPLLSVAYTDPVLQYDIMDTYFALQVNVAHCCFKENDYQACILHAQKVLELEPNSAPALYRRGQARAMLGRPMDLQWACCDFERVVMLDPKNHCAQQRLKHCRARLVELMQQVASRTAVALQEWQHAGGWQAPPGTSMPGMRAARPGESGDSDNASTHSNSPWASMGGSLSTTPPVGSPPVGSPRERALCTPPRPVPGTADNLRDQLTPQKVEMADMSSLAGMIRRPPGLDLPAEWESE